MSKDITNVLQNSKKMLNVVERNILETKNPGAHAIDTSIRIDALGNTGKYRTSVVNLRRDDPIKTKILFSSVNKASNSETKANALLNIQKIIDDPKDANSSLLVKAITEFISKSKILTANDDLSIRRSFIDNGIILTDTLNNAIERVKTLRIQADTDLNSSLVNLNDNLKQLNILNQAIATSFVPESLHNNRDTLIKNICKKLDVQVFFGRNGVAKLALTGGGNEIVTETGYLQFSYGGAKKDDILKGQNIPDITVTHYNGKGVSQSGTITVHSGSGNNDSRGLIGGEIESLINLRDNDLFLTQQTVQSLIEGVAKAVNGVHNQGSTWPPKTNFFGTSTVYSGQELELKGQTSFFALDSKGNQLSSGAGRIHETKIDFDKLEGNGTNGKPTVFNVIKEINQILDLSPSRERIAIGKIEDSKGIQIPGEYLLNNLQLGSMGKIDNNGNWSFDLDLQGNSYFGSKIEILRVNGPNGALAREMLPQEFILDKDTNTRTGIPITLNGFVSGGGIANVVLQIRITGDNGVINDGSVTFRVNQDTISLNDRVTYDNTIPLIPNNDFIVDGITSHTGVARAMLIDGAGNEITPSMGNMPGKLVIRTNSNDYRLAIKGGNFSSIFGLNNFFEIHPELGLINVKDTIINDVNQLSTGLVNKTDGTNIEMMIGDAAAKAELTFALGGIDFTAGLADRITIDGQVFSFVNGLPANPNEVQLGGGLIASLANLTSAINNHPKLRTKITANTDGIDKITLNAKLGGNWANALTASINLQGGSTAAINDGVMNSNAAGNLIGGTNKLNTVKVYDYTIGSGSREGLRLIEKLSETNIDFIGAGLIPGEHTSTLQEYATLITGAITQQYNQAKVESDIKISTLEALNKEDMQLFGSDPDEQFFNSIELIQYMKYIVNQIRMISSKVENIILDELLRI